MIAVIGAGITGAFLAFALAKKGCAVTVYDGHSVDYSGTSCNPGGINPFHGPAMPGIMADFYLDSYKEHLANLDQIQQLSNLDYDLKVVDRLFLAFNDNDVERLKCMEAAYRLTEGFSARWLRSKEVAQLESRISNNCVGGLLTTGNLCVNTPLYVSALKKSAQRLGAKFVDKNVSELVFSGNRASHVLVDKNKIPISSVAVTSGVWTVELLKPINPALKLRAVKGELLLAEIDGPPLSLDITYGLAGLYQSQPGVYWAGGTESCSFPDPGTTVAGREEILANLNMILPGITKIHCLAHYAGYRPMSEDCLPIVGRLNPYENIFIGTGGGSKGVLLSSGIARTLAGLINVESDKGLDFLSPDRFSDE